MCPPSVQVTEEGSSPRAASSPPPPPQQEHDQQQEQQQLEIPEPQPPLVDIGINPTFEPLQNQWRQIIERAVSANVRTVLLTGTNSRVWEQHEAMVNAWREEGGHDGIIRTTVGVHPCDADTFDPNSTIAEMRQRLTNDTSVVAVGECGLDYCRGQATADLQRSVFREQVALACELQIPLFLHEREAHDDFVAILDSFPSLPPVVVHCFTGTKEEVMAYIERGFYVGFTGIICKPDRGRALMSCCLVSHWIGSSSRLTRRSWYSRENNRHRCRTVPKQGKRKSKSGNGTVNRRMLFVSSSRRRNC